MKKIKKTSSLSRLFPPIIINLEDLEEIYNLLIDEGYKDITIKDKKNIFDDLDDLKNNLNKLKYDKLHYLEINSHIPYLNITFENKDIFVYFSEDTTQNIGMLEKISLLLKQKEKKVMNFIGGKKVFNFTLIVLLILMLIYALYDNLKILQPYFNIIYLINYIFFTFCFLINQLNKNEIILNNIYTNSWWFRNKDAIIVGIIVGIIVFGLSKLIEFLI
ncbi:MAG: hypothetical protein PHN56_00500 [Candidatus Nanoarchaeia archaeon]|nr:hypothetical protein [Candidatus Nanoarchaeia archaeon]